MKKVTSGGGWPAVWYVLNKARKSGGFWKTWKALRSKNACKTCAVGMGGQQGGMVNERGRFPEICKKSLQAMAADMQGAINDDFWSTYSVPQLQAMSPRDLEHCGRLNTPVLFERGTQYYRPITWDEAFERIAAKLAALTAEETFWYFSGRSSNEAGFLLQLMARLYGTNNVNNCSYYCHQASGVGLQSSVGSGTATLLLDDVEHADLVFVIGGNPPSNHPRIMTTLAHVRKRGGEVIVINPVIETGLVNFRIPSIVSSMLFGTKIATQYVQPHIGGDLALLTGIAKRIDELGAQDVNFLTNSCSGYEEWVQHLRGVPWSEIQERSGVSQPEINAMAEKYAAARNVVFSWTMGITHHAHGVQNVQAIANLALMRGMVGRPNAGLLPIRGHSNVQGIGSMGVTPKLKDAVFQNLEEHFGLKLPTAAGLDTMACMEAAHARQLKFGFCLGGNLYGSNPDSTYAEESLSRLEMLVHLSTTLNTGHAHGLADETIILPVMARDEEPQATTQESMFNYVRLSDGGPARLPGPRSEVEIIAVLGEKVLGGDGPIDWRLMRDTGRIRKAIAQVVPGFEQLDNIDKTKKEFQIPGRTFHTPQFPTPSGRATLHSHSLPELQGSGDQLRLMTVRSEGQFNTVVYEEEDLYRGQDRRDVILLHPDDIAQRGLAPEQRVCVRSDTGALKNVLVRSFEKIRAGNALMYYPEANVLVSRHSDPQSRTPAFKGVLVRIEP
ncbi:FdhF/YdeP family oxidoreductase [Lignipirellula cremea]|uniref:Formate dehydrogenase H n=1 Tax=Lignipirellula cremea TaxID=2528010 RepID=A0A518DQ10_9BACT|nr:FdhF/YdeP family oxidoreductase [Lignipirellula cremea]QDU93918.1 Formate dehydrogenase H [Lignipirellula cremea]